MKGARQISGAQYKNRVILYNVCVARKERCLAFPLDKDGMGRVPNNTHRPGYFISANFFGFQLSRAEEFAHFFVRMQINKSQGIDVI